MAPVITSARAGLHKSNQRRGVTPLVLLLKRSGNISEKIFDRHGAQQPGVDGGNAIGAVRSHDGEVGHADPARGAFFHQAYSSTRPRSPGKRSRTESSSRWLISKMISR